MSDHPRKERLAHPERLGAAEREELLRHVADCPDCRAAFVGGEPSRLFSTLALPALPEQALDRLSDRIATEIDRHEGERRAGRFWRVASIAASLVLAVGLGASLLRQPIESPAGVAGVPPVPPRVADAAPTAAIQLVSSPGDAQLIELSIGETQVLMIFDESMDL